MQVCRGTGDACSFSSRIREGPQGRLFFFFSRVVFVISWGRSMPAEAIYGR